MRTAELALCFFNVVLGIANFGMYFYENAGLSNLFVGILNLIVAVGIFKILKRI